MHWVKFNHKPLKFFIMTSAFIVGVTALLFWFIPNKSIEATNQPAIKNEQNNQVSLSEVIEKKVNHNLNKIVNPNIQSASQETNTEDDPILINENKNSEEKSEIKTFKNFAESQLPADTIIDGQNCIVILSDEELARLGFLLDETGLYYKNNFMGKISCFHSRGESNGGEITNIIPFENSHNKKRIFSNFTFYPVATSNINYTPREFKRQDFVSMNDTLLPILIRSSQLKCGSENSILWFKVSESLFNNLPQRYKKLQSDFEKIIILKKRNPNTDLIKYEARNITDGLRMIELSQSELQKLGFIFKENSIDFDTPLFEINLFKGGGHGITIHTFDGDEQLNSDNIQYSGNNNADTFKNSQIKLIYLSNEFGEQNVQWTGPNDDRDKNTFEKFQKKSQLLIPVYLSKSDYPEILYQDQLFWFEPSMALFDSMPDSVGQQLKREYIYITSDTKEKQKNQITTCTYFEACKSTLDVEDFKIFPNPANISATINITFPESTKGRISLLSITGVQIKSLVSETSFSQGINSFSVDVSDVLPGIYLVLLSTDDGFKTQRLIIKR